MPWKNEKKELGNRIVTRWQYGGQKMRQVPTKYLLRFVWNAYEQMADRKRRAQQELLYRRLVEAGYSPHQAERIVRAPKYKPQWREMEWVELDYEKLEKTVEQVTLEPYPSRWQ